MKKDIQKESFYWWTVGMIPAIFTGLPGITAWTTLSVRSGLKARRKEIDRFIRLGQSDWFKKFNDPKRMSETERQYFKEHPNHFKRNWYLGNGVHVDEYDVLYRDEDGYVYVDPKWLSPEEQVKQEVLRRERAEKKSDI